MAYTTDHLPVAVRRELRTQQKKTSTGALRMVDRSELFQIELNFFTKQHSMQAIIDQATSDYIGQFRVDFGIIGISGIDSDGTLLDFDYREVRVSRVIIENSRKVFLAADHTKFGRSAMVRLCPITDISALFTDREPPSGIREILAKNNVKLFLADR